jgi:hypothetical protein
MVASDADSRAVAAFTLGTLGLLAGSIFLGPAAIVLAITASNAAPAAPAWPRRRSCSA